MGDTTSIDDELQRVLDRGAELLASEEDMERFSAKQAERDRRDRLETSGISEHLDLRGADAIGRDAPERSRSLDLVRTWLVSTRPMLMLLGEPGQGKTVAAAWALARMSGRYVREQDLCEMRANWRTRREYRSHVRCELLVLDELGTERDPVGAADTFQDVVDNRQRSPRRTLLLGNLDRTKLVEIYDKRTLDRLGLESDDHGIAVIRSLKGPSMRKRSKEG